MKICILDPIRSLFGISFSRTVDPLNAGVKMRAFVKILRVLAEALHYTHTNRHATSSVPHIPASKTSFQNSKFRASETTQDLMAGTSRLNSDLLLVLTFIPSHRPQKGPRAEKLEAEQYLMGIIERVGYMAGKVYNCKMFVQDIGEELQCGVKVTFGPHPNGKPSKIMRLHEFHVLAENDVKEMVQGEKAQDEDAVFVFENLPIWKILG
ncbi:hypothetical protein POM88_005126 [Heracleum sosnowskyi]|uniref:Uncharacterized protein n=1 Tax=Heracleum sosnowskyi TaxID=360622 RepID=A0AAD8JMX4_9APIA|nr:hypothetical protein POM88_005126 [Heracleum sosnowskyi]